MSGPARGLVLTGAGLLALSLFLPWSHQFGAAFLARFGSNPALRGVPHDPDAWQLYTMVDVLLALLAAILAAVALRGPAGRGWLLAPVAVAVGFTLHALALPPTNGANIFDPAAGAYAAPGAGSGPGETVALVGLALAVCGLVAPPSRR